MTLLNHYINKNRYRNQVKYKTQECFCSDSNKVERCMYNQPYSRPFMTDMEATIEITGTRQ